MDLGLLLLAASLSFSAGAEAPPAAAPDAARLTAMADRFAPVDIRADVSRLPANEQQALARIVEAARNMDPPFLLPVRPGHAAALFELPDDASPLGRAP